MRLRKKCDWKAIGVLSILLTVTGCSSGGEGLNTGDSGGGGADTEPQLSTESCLGSSTGFLETELGNIDYEEGILQGEGALQIEQGCLTEMSLRFERSDGCPLELSFTSSDGVWTLAGASLALDASCGLEESDDAFGTYTLQSGGTGAIVGTQVFQGEEESECLSASGMSLLGKATLANGAQTLDLKFNDLKLSGEFFSTRTSEVSCPTEVEACADAFCGSDEFGVACGSCGIGYECDAGQCGLNTCPPLPPFGTHPFNSLTDLTVYDCDGSPVNLHELCGAPVGYFNLLAGW